MASSWTKGFITSFLGLIDLKGDTDQAGSIQSIRAGAEFKSANAWTLIFAIFIASVGLNVNSTAVIIGAMLVSPLMGPIVGIGLALGIYDFELLKKSGRNLIISVFISVATSTIYFWMSPLSDAQSELLARTHPTFFDVLIAFFGGAAGIVAVSRKEKGNAIPGVAIATALMPPLCTAGFGVASGHLDYFAGALYLFLINSVFISLSTYIFVRYLKFPEVIQPDEAKQKKIHRWIAGITVTTIVPSLVFVWFLQLENSFKNQANRFINQEIKFDRTFIVNKKIDYSFNNPKIRLTLLGRTLDDKTVQSLKDQMKLFDLKPEMLELKQYDFFSSSEKAISTESKLSEELKSRLVLKENQLSRFNELINVSQKTTSEVSIFIPKVDQILFYATHELDDDVNDVFPINMNILWKSPPLEVEIEKVDSFLKTRIEFKIDSKKNFIKSKI